MKKSYFKLRIERFDRSNGEYKSTRNPLAPDRGSSGGNNNPRYDVKSMRSSDGKKSE